MNNLKKQLDKELKDVHFPIGSFKHRLESAKSSKKQSQNLRQLCAAIAAAALFICSGGAGIYAGINYFWQRGSQLSQNEQDAYVEDISNAEADADTYSRELTKEERLRKDELMDRYLNEGLYPQRKLKKISSPEEAQADCVCFLPEMSTFYLPERELNDEDLLEIIDHDLMVDYSLAQQERGDRLKQDIKKKEQKELSRQDMDTLKSSPDEISKEEAIACAKDAIAKLFDETDPDSLMVETEEVTYRGNDQETTVPFETIQLSKDYGKTNYQADVNLQTGEIESIFINDMQTDLTETLVPDDISNRNLLNNIKKKTCFFASKDATIKKSYIQVIKNQGKHLAFGIVHYYFEMDNDKILEVIYSYASQRIYAFSNLTKQEFSEKTKEAMIQCTQDGNIYQLLELNEM